MIVSHDKRRIKKNKKKKEGRGFSLACWVVKALELSCIYSFKHTMHALACIFKAPSQRLKHIRKKKIV
jgi:hypothetical protein